MTTRVGYTFGQNTGTTAVPVANPAGAAAGDLIVLALTAANNSLTLTDYTGWTLLGEKVYNTRKTFILSRAYQATYPNIVVSANNTVGSTVMAFRADSGQSLQPPVIGTIWDRPSNGGSITTTQAPAVSAAEKSVSIALFAEVSTGAETEEQVTLSGTGWSKWFYGDTDPAQAAAVNYFVGYRDFPSADASTTATSTWPNASNNSMGVQINIPQTSSTPVPVETGQVTSAGCYNFGQDYLVIGHKKLLGVTHEVALFNAAGTTELQRKTSTHDSTTSWGSVTFTALTPGTEYQVKYIVDGTTQTDVGGTYKTLSNSNSSFVFVAGSCQFTGSNHPVFDKMREDNPVFLAHMGDLHYADATTEPAWRAGVDSSLNTSRMRTMLSRVPMSYIWDNHDIIRTDPLGGGSTVCQAEWKHLAGSTGWASSDTAGRAWKQGGVLMIHTDLRSARDNYQTAAEPRALMGSAQKTWFKNLLTSAESDETVTAIIWFTTWTSVLWGSGRWGSYASETAELEAHINSLPRVKSRMVQIGADSHNLQADSGARNYPEAAFKGIPSLNISGFNRSSTSMSGFTWDIAEASLREEAQPEADWGGYSRVTFTDSGNSLDMLWEAVRVGPTGNTDIMATYTESFSKSGGESLWSDVRLGNLQVNALYVGNVAVWSA